MKFFSCIFFRTRKLWLWPADILVNIFFWSAKAGLLNVFWNTFTCLSYVYTPCETLLNAVVSAFTHFNLVKTPFQTRFNTFQTRLNTYISISFLSNSLKCYWLRLHAFWNPFKQLYRKYTPFETPTNAFISVLKTLKLIKTILFAIIPFLKLMKPT